MNKRRVILWFRNDLRLHDHEALQEAISHSDEIYPVYVFDERILMGRSRYGFRKTGVFRARFLLESVENLRKNLKAIGSNLLIRIGKPEDVIFELAKELKTKWVFCNRERTHEEVLVQDSLERNLWEIGQEVRFSRGKMLYYTADLPFPVTHTPDVFTQFRKEVEKIVPIRDPFLPPTERLPVSADIDTGKMPILSDFDFSSEEIDLLETSIYKGGEDEGLKRLNHYFWESDQILNYKNSYSELMGRDYSSKFSPYLAHGCLSPKKIYQELKRYEVQRGSCDSTYHLFYELLWRDFFRLMAKKYGNLIFLKGGSKKELRQDLTDDLALFRIWAEGRTGMPIVDASMKELSSTGYLSNRARQNVASFLVNDLHINWQIGAEYFESVLIDYDPCSNWGNWNYIAGVGSDHKDRRTYNVINQAKKYDPQTVFIKHWLPELKDIPIDKAHQPYLLSKEEQEDYNCVLQKDYPQLCINKMEYQ